MHKHTILVVFHLLTDVAILALSMVGGMLLITYTDWQMQWEKMWPAVAVGATAMGAIGYIGGLYMSSYTCKQNAVRELASVTLQVAVCQALATLAMVIFFYFNFSTRIGRGIMLAGSGMAYALMLAHHVYLRRKAMFDARERIAYVVLSAHDEGQAALLGALDERHFRMVGVLVADYRPGQLAYPVLGTLEEAVRLTAEQQIARVVCTTDALDEQRYSSCFCTLRYSGVQVTSLLSLCEELYQCVPIPLVNANWLLAASDSPFMPYIKKMKRMSDVAMALTGLVVLWPLLVAGMILVKLTSPGPVIYRQRRCGRFGKVFEVLKLRTMRVDAEAAGAQWSTANDSRVTPVGRVLRKYRIDELPQLFNVLRGEMSFVGPRPERPEFVEPLAEQIPFYRERLLVLPGITGWAQVRYPYGSSVEDARRKLEFDLYYMKHMGVLLDALIILDTIRTVLRGTHWQDEAMDVSAHLAADERLAETDGESAGPVVSRLQ